MRETTEITAIGPYVRVTLPDVLPPNWEELTRDLEPELDEGASLVTFVLGPCCGVDRDDHRSSRSWSRFDPPESSRGSCTDGFPLHATPGHRVGWTR